MTKPFWFGTAVRTYLNGFQTLVRAFERARVIPPAKVLELGGGCGWTAEFLALLGFKVVSTTISPHHVQMAARRIEALRARQVPFELEFLATPMESVADRIQDRCPFDAAFVWEALHHAFDWRAAITSVFSCLKADGWLFLCEEPNLVHTAVSYRAAKLSNTHEIGFSRRELVRHLRQTGFRRVISLGKRPHLWVRPHFLLAQR